MRRTKEQLAQQGSQLAAEFFGFQFDFFMWVIAFWIAGMLIGFLIAVSFIPNKDPPLFFVFLNLFLAFFVLAKTIRWATTAKFQEMFTPKKPQLAP